MGKTAFYVYNEEKFFFPLDYKKRIFRGREKAWLNGFNLYRF